MIRVIEIADKNIPGDVYGIAYNCGKRLLDSELSTSALMYGKTQIVAKKQGDNVNVLVITIGGNFGSTPRIFGKNDGYGSDGVAIGEGKVAYPLAVNTQTLTINDDNTVEVSRDGLVYGNIDWKGKNTSAADEPSNAPILTWKGPTGRSIPFDYTKPIEGLTTPDIVFSETDEKFTCFGPDIYEGGSVAFTAIGSAPVDIATKVLGCAYQGSTLVCIVNNHYPDKIGFFEEVWATISGVGLYDEKENPGGWRLLNSRLSGRPTMIWAFNQSGTKAAQGVSEYSIDLAAGAATFDPGTNTQIQAQYDSDPHNHSVAFSGRTTIWSDYKGDERVFAHVEATGGAAFNYASDGGSTTVKKPVYMTGTPPESTAYIVFTGSAIPDLYASLAGSFGGCCDNTVKWSISSGSINQDTGQITSLTGCGMGTVTATGSCGAVVTKQIKLSSGYWCGVISNAKCGPVKEGCAQYGGSTVPCYGTPSRDCTGYCKINALNSGNPYYDNSDELVGIKVTTYWGYVSSNNNCGITSASGRVAPYTGTALPVGYTLKAQETKVETWQCPPCP